MENLGKEVKGFPFNFNGAKVNIGDKTQYIYAAAKPSAGADLTLTIPQYDENGNISDILLVASEHTKKDKRNGIGATAGGNCDAHTPDMTDEEKAKTDISTGHTNPSALNTAIREFVEEAGIDSFIESNSKDNEKINALFKAFGLKRNEEAADILKDFSEQLSTRCVHTATRSSNEVAGQNRIMYGVGYTVLVEMEAWEFLKSNLEPSDDIGRFVLFSASQISCDKTSNDRNAKYLVTPKDTRDGKEAKEATDTYPMDYDKMATHAQCISLVMAQRLCSIVGKEMTIGRIEGVAQVINPIDSLLPQLEDRQNSLLENHKISKTESVNFNCFKQSEENIFPFLTANCFSEFKKLEKLCNTIKILERDERCKNPWSKARKSGTPPAPSSSRRHSIC